MSDARDNAFYWLNHRERNTNKETRSEASMMFHSFFIGADNSPLYSLLKNQILLVLLLRDQRHIDKIVVVLF